LKKEYEALQIKNSHLEKNYEREKKIADKKAYELEEF
jgi:hypothetical protein